jgi:hypothetical protein
VHSAPPTPKRSPCAGSRLWHAVEGRERSLAPVAERFRLRKPARVAEPLEDPLGCTPLLLRPIHIGRQNRFNNAPLNASSIGRNGCFVRTYPGGTENFSIFETVLALMPNRSAAARSLIPSIKPAYRTRA